VWRRGEVERKKRGGKKGARRFGAKADGGMPLVGGTSQGERDEVGETVQSQPLGLATNNYYFFLFFLSYCNFLVHVNYHYCNIMDTQSFFGRFWAALSPLQVLWLWCSPAGGNDPAPMTRVMSFLHDCARWSLTLGLTRHLPQMSVNVSKRA